MYAGVGQPWISTYTYLGIHQYMAGWTAPAAATNLQDAQSDRLVGGTVVPDGPATLDPLFRFESDKTHTLSEPGPYALVNG